MSAGKLGSSQGLPCFWIAIQSAGFNRAASKGELSIFLVDFESKSTPSILMIGHFGELKFDV
jgi:hypothetical protein